MTMTLKFKLEAATRLIPYIKLVERERLRVPVKSQTAYEEFFASDEFDRLFDDLIGEQLTLSQIVSLLGDSPLSTGELSERLGVEAVGRGEADQQCVTAGIGQVRREPQALRSGLGRKSGLWVRGRKMVQATTVSDDRLEQIIDRYRCGRKRAHPDTAGDPSREALAAQGGPGAGEREAARAL